MDVNGKTAVVTGGAKGYGAGITRVLSGRGVQVCATGRDETALDRIASETGATPVRADVTVPQDWDRVFSTVTEQGRELDILVNNAGAGIKIAPLTEMTDEEIRQSIAVNLTGAVFGCRRAAEHMKKQGNGTIINISSVCQGRAWPGFAVYSAAKAGISQLSKCLYTELRESGVRVTTLVPSWGATGFGDAAGLPSRPPETSAKCIQPEELGKIVADICELPSHLEIQDMTVWPLIQEVVPM